MIILIWYIIGLAGYVFWWRQRYRWEDLYRDSFSTNWFITSAFLTGFLGIFVWIFGYLIKDE